MSERLAKEARRAARFEVGQSQAEILAAHEQQIRIHAHAINTLMAEGQQFRATLADAEAKRLASRSKLQRLRAFFGR